MGKVALIPRFQDKTGQYNRQLIRRLINLFFQPSLGHTYAAHEQKGVPKLRRVVTGFRRKALLGQIITVTQVDNFFAYVSVSVFAQSAAPQRLLFTDISI